MKGNIKFIYIIIVLFFSSLFYYSTAQNNSSRQPDIKTLDNAYMRVVYSAQQKCLEDKDTVIMVDTMALDIGNKWSVYYDLNYLRKDSAEVKKFVHSPRSTSRFSTDNESLQKRLESTQEIFRVVDIRRRGESAKTYKDRQAKQIMTIDNGPLEAFDTYTLFRFIEDIHPQHWEIATDTLAVLGYNCQKATTSFRGRNYTAWFAMDIPVSEGPWKLYGLPGMILKVEDIENIFSFTAIGLEKLNDFPIEVSNVRTYHYKEGDFTTIYKFIDGDLRKWKEYRKNEFSKIYIAYLDADAVSYYRRKNPIKFFEIE